MFPVGRMVATPGVLAFCKSHGINPIHIFVRHLARDWGEMDPEDRRANERAILDGSRIFSAFVYQGERVWCITEADRSVTTLLLPEEY